eukprot:1148242-Pelagomonas_calceolata.AAC.2
MALGENIISGYNVLSHICHMEDTQAKRNLQEQFNLSRYYTRGLGNFNITILNHYLTFDWTGGTTICIRDTIALATQCSLAYLDSKGRFASIILQGANANLLLLGT